MRTSFHHYALIAAAFFFIMSGNRAHADTIPLSEELTLQTPTGSLYGTLLIAMPSKATPIVVFHAGSGPTDRDGNTVLIRGKNDGVKQLAEGLAARGISSFRYDKRGVGKSLAAGGQEIDLRFDAYVDDMVAWIERLKRDNRFSAIVIAGHSEGSLIGMLAAQKAPAAAFISLAGPGRRISDILREQLRPQLDTTAFAAADRILTSLESGVTARDTSGMPAALAQSLFRPTVQPYLISWMRWAPTTEITRLAMPALILQGNRDIQVSGADASLLKAAKPDAELKLFPAMNHVLKQVEDNAASQQTSYVDPAIPLADGLVEAIAGFVERNTRR